MHIKVRVEADAKRDSIEEIAPGRFAISVREKAAENRANLRVLELLARHLGRDQKDLRIVKGHRTPSKIVSVR